MLDEETSAPLTSSAAASPASPTVTPASCAESTTSDTSGTSTPESLASYDPRYVVVENVANILADGTALAVLGDLAALGYDADWSVVSACAVGAPHTRERLFILADSHGFNGEARVWSQQQRRQNAHERGVRGTLSLVDQSTWLEDPSPLYRVDDGIPLRVERNTALGNAVVPQVAEVVGRLIAERENDLLRSA